MGRPVPKLPDKLPVDPSDIPCPRGGAEAGYPCVVLGPKVELELVHVERIEAAFANQLTPSEEISNRLTWNLSP